MWNFINPANVWLYRGGGKGEPKVFRFAYAPKN